MVALLGLYTYLIRGMMTLAGRVQGQSLEAHGEREARTYNRGRGRDPSGVQAQPLIRCQGRSPLKLKVFLHLRNLRSWPICA